MIPRLTLSDDDVVLVCMTTDEEDALVVPGSSIVQCGECGRDLWRAPGPPLARMDAAGIRPLHPLTPRPTPTVILCIRCAQMHATLSGWRG